MHEFQVTLEFFCPGKIINSFNGDRHAVSNHSLQQKQAFSILVCDVAVIFVLDDILTCSCNFCTFCLYVDRFEQLRKGDSCAAYITTESHRLLT